MRVRVGIVGFRGYSGAELVQILKRHAQVEPVLIEHRADSEERPEPLNSRSSMRVACSAQAVADHAIKVVFLATPANVSMELAPAMLEAGASVIDISGAFRLRTEQTFERWYKEKHTAANLLSQAVYGLPEMCRKQIAGARLIANPGCYPTAANLAIQPLIAANAIDRSAGIVCDAKSGVSGAGRKPALRTSFCEVTENFSTYSVFNHRHVPEILMVSGVEESELSFTPQLIPIERGILETIYFRTRFGAEQLLDIYQRRYPGEPFVRFYQPGVFPDLRAVAHTNFCDIGLMVDQSSGRAMIVSAIDNLVKGAAGQAVQNMNLMLGYPETEGFL